MSEPPTEASARPRNPLRRLYDWVMHWAETPYGLPALFVLAIAESSFFPIPPDVLLVALALAAPTRAFRFAAWCTLGSVIGGVLGYGIGTALWSTFEPLMIGTIFSQEKFDAVQEIYDEYGIAFVLVAGFTPLPYKVFTITAGVAELNLPSFIGVSFVGRGARFFLVAGLVKMFGQRAKEVIDKKFNLLTIGFTVLLIAGFLAFKFLL